MKKIVSMLICIVMVFSTLIPIAGAINPEIPRSEYPVIYLMGNSTRIVDSTGKCVNDADDISFGDDSDDGDNSAIEAVRNILFPHFFKGLLTGDFEAYYDVFEKEIGEMHEGFALDENGQPLNGTGISEQAIKSNETNAVTDKYNNGYGYGDYPFSYDWRLDPLKNADYLNEYINSILETTGKDKICLTCDCLGGTPIMAYLAKYGHDKIHALGFRSTVAFGCELISDTFSGDMVVDPDSVVRFSNDEFLLSRVPEEYTFIMKVIYSCLQFANETGALEGMTDAFMEKLYNRLAGELLPRLSLTYYATLPGYWSMVEEAKFEKAKTAIFGATDSERYTKYQVLIEQLNNYDVQVRQRIPDILTACKEDGVNICILSKYGFQFPPVLESYNDQSDIWVSVKFSSLGATTSPITQTLSDEYIAERTALGYGKYISPDNIVDASTCLLPENTWFLKNVMHDEGPLTDYLIMKVCSGESDVTINDIEGVSQFMVYNRETKDTSIMTADNCHTESYYEKTYSSGFDGVIERIKDFFNEMKEFADSYILLIKKLMNNSINKVKGLFTK